MNRQQTLDKIEREWKKLLASFEGLPEAALLEPGAVGEWSVRDVMAHVATWEEEAFKALPVILDDKSPPRYVRYGGIDAFNAQEQEEKRHLPLALVRQGLEVTHRRLLDYLAGVPEDVFLANNRFQRRLRYDTHRHYREHAIQIVAWRNATGL